MTTITRDRLLTIQLWRKTYGPGSNVVLPAEEAEELARNALASLEAEAVGEVVLGEYDDCGCHPDARVECIAADGQADWENFKDGTRLYAAPPSMVVIDERAAFNAWNNDENLPIAGVGAKNAAWLAWQARAKLAAPPAPVSVPDEVNVLLNHLEDVLPDEAFNLIDVKTWNNVSMLSRPDVYRAAMLQGAEPVTTAYKLPGDFESFISWLTSGDGIPDWLINGDKLDDEKVSFLLKVYRAGSRDANGKKGEGIFVSKSSEMSVSGITIGESQCRNSPVIPDCSCRTCRPVTFSDSRFVVCPECGNKRCPHANDHRNACTGSNEPGQEGSAYPAAPQQEVK